MYLRHLCSAWHYITPRQGICQGIFGIFFAKRENTAQYQKVAQKEVSFFVHFASMVPAADSAALPPGKNACEASHIFTRSVAHLYTLCVYRAAPRRPVFYSAFSKAGEMFPKRNGFILFASTKRTKSSPEGCDPLDSEGRFKTLQNIFSCCFRLSSLSRYVVRPAFSDVLNRCERVIAVQTQDRYFSKMGSHTTSLQEQATFEKGGCSLSLLRWEFVFAVCGLKVLS